MSSPFSFEKFATSLKQNSAIWDPNHKDYRNKAVRERQWRNISRTMECGVLLCRNKYKKIREQYRKLVLEKQARNEIVSWPLKYKFDFLRRAFKDHPVTPNSSEDGNNLRRDPLYLDPDEMSETSFKLEDILEGREESEQSEHVGMLRIAPQTQMNGFVQIPEPSPTTFTQPSFQQPHHDSNIAIVAAESLRQTNDRIQRPSNDFSSFNGFNGNNSSSHHSQIIQAGHVSTQPSGFCLALEEKMRILPPRIRNRLERDIFVMVSNEVMKLYD